MNEVNGPEIMDRSGQSDGEENFTAAAESGAHPERSGSGGTRFGFSNSRAPGNTTHGPDAILTNDLQMWTNPIATITEPVPT